MGKAQSGGLAAALAVPAYTHRCPLGRIIDEVDDDDRKAIEAAIEAVREHRKRNGTKAINGPTAAWLASTLTENGHHVSRDQASAHIGERCTCQ